MQKWKVDFIGSGYESVKRVFLEAETAGEAIRRAEALYESFKCAFDYNEIEAIESI